jgi:ribosomal protein S18 acetylase RimI-like enzyme
LRAEEITVRRLGSGDADVVHAFADGDAHTALLDDERTIFLAAFRGGDPVGFVLAYELPRRRGHERMLCVYEVDVRAADRGRGVGTRLMRELESLARARGVGKGFVLTDADNEPANRLYAGAGGEAREVVEWDFRYAER